MLYKVIKAAISVNRLINNLIEVQIFPMYFFIKLQAHISMDTRLNFLLIIGEVRAISLKAKVEPTAFWFLSEVFSMCCFIKPNNFAWIVYKFLFGVSGKIIRETETI